MFSAFTKILKIPLTLHKNIKDEDVLLLNYMMTLYVIDRNDIILYSNSNIINIIKVPSTIIKEHIYFGNDIVSYKYLSTDRSVIESESIPVLQSSNQIFLNGTYVNKKLIVKLEKNIESDGGATYELVYYYNTDGVNRFLNGNISTSYILKYLFDKQERNNILKKTNDDLNVILNTCFDNTMFTYEDIDSRSIFENITLYDYQKCDIKWMKCIEYNVDHGYNNINFQRKFTYDILNNTYSVSCDLKTIYPKYIADTMNIHDPYFTVTTTNFSYYGGNLISEVGLGKTLIMLYTIFSDPIIHDPLYDFIEYDNSKCNYFYKLGNKKGKSCDKPVENDQLFCKEHKKSIFIDKKTIKYRDYFNTYFNMKNYIFLDENTLIKTKSTMIICPSHLCDQWVREYYNKCTNQIKSKTNVLLVTTYNQYCNLTVGDVLFSDIVVISYNFFTNANYLRKSKSFDKSYANMMQPGFINQREFSFHMFKWHRVVFEEFHEISNMCKVNMIEHYFVTLKSKYRWNISGTPFANGVIGIIDSLKLNTSLYISQFDKNVELNPVKTMCHYGLNTNLIQNCSFLFKRNTRQSVSNEYKGNIIKNNTKLLTFTTQERTIYDSHLIGYNTKYSKFLLQLCCHPELYSETKQLIANCKSLSEIQDVLLQHHKINLNKSLRKIKAYEKEINHIQSDVLLSTCTLLQQKLAVAKRNLTNEKKTYDSIKNTLNYLQRAIKDIKNQETCPICLEEIEQLVITSCGHKFCSKCCEEYIKTASRYKCPLCNNILTQDEMYLLNETINDIKADSELNQIINDIKSTKIGNIVYWLKNEIQTNKKSKIIIFSQWDELLHKVGEYISKYNINVLYCKGSVYQKKKSIVTFSEKDDHNIILLSSQNAASGINLTKANKIVFIETIIGDYQYRTNTENQAIGRSARIGNNQEIEIVKFIINDTIESDIHNNMIDDKILFKMHV
jgi:hypothetical protein